MLATTLRCIIEFNISINTMRVLRLTIVNDFVLAHTADVKELSHRYSICPVSKSPLLHSVLYCIMCKHVEPYEISGQI